MQAAARPSRGIRWGLCAALIFGAGCARPAPSPTAAQAAQADPVTATSTPLLTAIPTARDSPSATVPSPTATASPQPPTPTETPTDAPPTATAPPPVVRFMAVGDVMLARSVGDRLLAQGPGIVFQQVQPWLDQADLFALNLECVISDRGAPEPKAYTFRAPPAAVEALALAGVDVVSLANNHALDYGVEALGDMLPRLREANIQAVGAGADAGAARAPAVVVRNGLRVAFLAYVDVPVEGRTGFDTRSWEAGIERPGLAWAVPSEMAFDIASARLRADVIVVLVHFGLEGRREATAGQRALAQGAIDAGAHLVIGAHPHVLQPVEAYNGGLIVYSLGNFVFDGFVAPATYSAIFSATLTLEGVADYEFLPVVVSHGLPRPADEREAATVWSLLGLPGR
jgi:poly-gamma-glutamate capsule biosynthesis protein CapA/YwtB (metallophosphatase superfamily)